MHVSCDASTLSSEIAKKFCTTPSLRTSSIIPCFSVSMDLFDGLPEPESPSVTTEVSKTPPGFPRAASANQRFALTGSAIPIHYASLTPTTVPSTFDGHGKKRTYQNMESCGRPSSAFKLNSETADDSRCAAGSVASDQKCDAISENILLRAFRVEMQGERDEMEDKSVMNDNVQDQRMLSRLDISRVSFYGVFDGHNGGRASHSMSTDFLDTLMAKFVNRGGLTARDLDTAVIGALIAAYKSVDAMFLAKAAKQKPPLKDGTTATTALFINNKGYLANVGDSMAVLCRYDPVKKEHKPLTLTVDHNPTLYEERQRIQQQGGVVKNGRLNGVLEVSRSIGDLPYKKNSGLICTPSVHKCSLTSDDRFIVMACDGLWKALSPSDVIRSVLGTIENSTDSDLDARYNSACAALAKEALKRLSGDNVTVIVIRIGPPLQTM